VSPEFCYHAAIDTRLSLCHINYRGKQNAVEGKSRRFEIRGVFFPMGESDGQKKTPAQNIMGQGFFNFRREDEKRWIGDIRVILNGAERSEKSLFSYFTDPA
jgi:hypothetical protein